jgi:hypothetical protein
MPRRVALPPPGWTPPSKVDETGLRVTVANEGGLRSKVVDLRDLPGSEGLRRDLALALAYLNGPAGTWKRLANFRGVRPPLRTLLIFMESRGIETFADLTASAWNEYRIDVQDNSRASARNLGVTGTVVRCVPALPELTLRTTMLRRPLRRRKPQPTYTGDEFNAIRRSAQLTVRQAYRRISRNADLLARLDRDDLTPAEALKAKALHEVAMWGRPSTRVGYQCLGAVGLKGQINARNPILAIARSSLFLTSSEALAGAALLICSEGFNVSVIDELDVPSGAATSAEETGAWTVRTDKPRRGAARRFNTSVLPENGDDSPGKFMRWLIGATAPGREFLSRDAEPESRLIIWWGVTHAEARPRAGVPIKRGTTTSWWPEAVTPLCNLAMLHRTYITRINRKPAHHTRRTHLQDYLLLDRATREEMAPVIEAGLLAAIAEGRRRLQITLTTGATDPAKDTVLASCADFEHHPDTGLRCGDSFLTCLMCRNAVATPRHLPRLVALREALEELRSALDPELWEAHFAGAYFSLLALFETRLSQPLVESARGQISAPDRANVRALLNGVYL